MKKELRRQRRLARAQSKSKVARPETPVKRKGSEKRSQRPYEPVSIFFVVPTGEFEVFESFECKAGHFNRIPVGRFGEGERPEAPWGKTIPCPKCGEPARLFSQGWDQIYRRYDTGEELPAKLPPGAVREGIYQGKAIPPLGPDGRSLWCILPNGHEWGIDGRASNCTMPDDNEHRCWVRTGKPEDGTLNVGKKGGPTCAAGAGSIWAGDFHGFLRNGVLKSC